MDRKMCVIVYSTYSPSCKQLIDYIKSLSYDFMAITGACLLCADSEAVRDTLYSQNILQVPCMLIQYVDGHNVILNSQDLYHYILAVTDSVSQTNQQKHTTTQQPAANDKQPEQDAMEIPIVDRTLVSSLAMDMQKARESAEPEHPNPLKRTQLFS